MSTKTIKKIIWAIDTFEAPEFQRNALFALGALTRGTDAEVIPIHVLRFPTAIKGELTEYEQAYLALADKRLKELPQKSDIPTMKEGKVLIDREGKVRTSVEMLVDFALEYGADAIVASTHSRSTVSRLFMGSFAETLLLQSDVPVVSVNPSTQVRESIAKVLFPTTFGEQFFPAFQATVKLCSLLKADLTLLYKEPFIPMIGVEASVFSIMDQEAKERQRTAEQWRNWAKDYGVPVEIRLDSFPGNVADEIESYAAKHRFDLIVMVSQTSEVFDARVGSICRKVVRGAECPVWTMKTESLGDEEFL